MVSVVGFADNEKLNAEGAETVTVVLRVAVPPAPLHDTEYCVVELGETLRVPLVAPPVLKLVPVHDVALVDDHVSVDD